MPKKRSGSRKFSSKRVSNTPKSLNIKLDKSVLKDFDFNGFKDTSEIPVPKGLVGQVIGQEKSVEIIRKAAAQKRNVLLVGLPGTGKSLLAQAMSEILPVGFLQDVLIYPNSEDPNNPKVRVVKAGEGKKILDGAHFESHKAEDSMRLVSLLLPVGWMVLSTILWQMKWYPDVVFAAFIIVGAFLFIGVTLGNQMRPKESIVVPKLLVNNLGKKVAPFFEATGSRAGALLGDVRHDPLQCHYGFNNLYILKGKKLIVKPFAELWDEMIAKYKSEIIKNEKGYEAIMLPEKEKIFTLGEKEGKVVLSRILSLNRKPFDGELTEIEARDKKIALTPEHKVITKSGDKKAEKISTKDSLFQLSQSKANA
jgi:Lon-like ATP-dependent protease